jgi:peptide/nickel transport system ATP-binding protein
MSVMPTSAPLLEVKHLGRRFALPRAGLFQPAGALQALSDVSFTLQPGKSLGIVGESGSGKSTLARLVMALDKPTEGQVVFKGVDVHQTHGQALRQWRSGFQMVFQDPYGSLDPRQKVLAIVTEPIQTLLKPADGRSELRDRAAQALSEVGLRTADLDKYPHEFSGGQRQRIAIARALITRPALIVADEPVSALDVSVQAQVLDLLKELQREFRLTYLFVAHNLDVVRNFCDRVAVMRKGRIVELAATGQIFSAPQHAYTKILLSAVPSPDPDVVMNFNVGEELAKLDAAG